MALVDGNLGTAIYKAQKIVNDAFKEHEKHVTEIIVQNHYLLEDSARLYKENDKLREFVAEIYEDQCDDGDRWKYRDRMQELGIKF